MTTGKTIALTSWTFVGKVMSLLFNMLPRLVIAFLPRSKCLLISWQQSPSTVILDPKKIKSLTLSIVSPSICHEVMGPENEDHGIWSHHFMGNRWGNSGNSVRLFFSAPKSLQMVTAAMKLKDTCSLEEKL